MCVVFHIAASYVKIVGSTLSIGLFSLSDFGVAVVDTAIVVVLLLMVEVSAAIVLSSPQRYFMPWYLTRPLPMLFNKRKIIMKKNTSTEKKLIFNLKYILGWKTKRRVEKKPTQQVQPLALHANNIVHPHLHSPEVTTKKATREKRRNDEKRLRGEGKKQLSSG